MNDRVQMPSKTRLHALLGYLRQDPANLHLIADAAAEALDQGDLGVAGELIEQYAALAPLPLALVNLEGLIALRSQRFGDAGRIFEALLPSAPHDPALRFNLAWARVMTRDDLGALELLDKATARSSAQAATLKIQALHSLGRLDEALNCGEDYARRFGNAPMLMGALAVAAFDGGRLELAERYASKGGDSQDSLSTFGMLNLHNNQIQMAAGLFDQALATYPQNARALVGKGITQLAQGDAATAAVSLKQGAEIFGTHLGSWVAAGWAYFVGGDNKSSRAMFEKALSLDDTFAETHGGLAVLDIIEGKLDSAKRRTDIALRLDRSCFSGALAKSLILDSGGQQRAAERIREMALNSQLGPSGKTLAQAMAGFGSGGGRNMAGQ